MDKYYKEHERQITENLHGISSLPVEDILINLETSTEGITEEEAELRLEKHGPNEIVYEKRSPWYVFLLRSFKDPFILILLAIVLLSYFTDVAFAPVGEKSWVTIIIIMTMVLISVILRFSQEYKSQITADNLKDLVPTTTRVERIGSNPREIVMDEVVPGDIIYLAAGDLVPADMRLISCKDLFISQSSLTGESEPVEKFAETMDHDVARRNAADLTNIVLMGT